MDARTSKRLSFPFFEEAHRAIILHHLASNCELTTRTVQSRKPMRLHTDSVLTMRDVRNVTVDSIVYSNLAPLGDSKSVARVNRGTCAILTPEVLEFRQLKHADFIEGSQIQCQSNAPDLTVVFTYSSIWFLMSNDSSLVRV